MCQSHRRATFKTFAWSAMKTAVAGANAVNAVSSFVSPAIHTDTLLVSVISSAVAYEERGGIGFRAPGVSVGIGTAPEETEEKGHMQKAVLFCGYAKRNLKWRRPIASAVLSAKCETAVN